MTLREAGQLYIIVLLQYFDIHEILAHLNEKDAMLIIMTMLWAAKTVSYAMSITLWHLTYWSFIYTPLIKTAFIHEANHNSAKNYDYVMNTSSCRTLLFKLFTTKTAFISWSKLQQLPENAPPWGICSFSKTKWQMPGDGDGHAGNWLSHYEARTPSK